ncbi:C40 family peptidase [uncultured Mailhella sp.]|uniref:C40 family peptidase n=1 Tax=uncultured Mailhella sp. TaxID=1981031 RepID=UPI0026046D53|nr:C40 family peptidase [uncultured Mailhella sp.]
MLLRRVFPAALAGLALLCSAQTSCALPESSVAQSPVPELPAPRLAPAKGPAVNLCPTVMSLGENVSGIAREQLGVRYRRGGSSPRSGFDCSGFVYWVFARHGVRVPRDSVRQSSAGHKVEKKDLLPGDILVFRIPRTPNGRHTAIYIGKGRFIHSPTSGSRVRVESLSDSYWRKHYYTARRVLKAPPCELDIYSDPNYVNSQLLTGDISASPEGPTSR